MEGDSTNGIHSGTISDSGKFASHLASNICTTSLFGSYLVSKICVIFLLTYPIILLKSWLNFPFGSFFSCLFMCLEYAAIAGTEKSCPTSEQTPNNHEQVTHRGKLDVEALKGCSHNVSWNYHCWCLNWFWFAMLLRCKHIQWMVYQLILINIMKLEKSDRQSEE